MPSVYEDSNRAVSNPEEELNADIDKLEKEGVEVTPEILDQLKQDQNVRRWESDSSESAPTVAPEVKEEDDELGVLKSLIPLELKEEDDELGVLKSLIPLESKEEDDELGVLKSLIPLELGEPKEIKTTEEPKIPKSRRDSAWSFGVDQAQKLAGKGVEVFGKHFDIDYLENLGKEYVADQEQDIKEGGYKPEYTGSWTDNVKQGTGIGWFSEKFAENAAQGGVALVGGATTAIVGAFSAPAALVVGTGVSVGTLGLTWAMGIGEVAQEMEDKGVDVDTGLAVGTGALIALLDKFGAGKVISKSEIARATGSELVEKLVGAGFKDAAGAVAKTIVKKAGIEAGTEVLQEGAVVGASAIKGAKYTADELVDRAIDSAILGGSMGASFGSVDVGKDVFTSRSLESDLRTQMNELIKENGVTYNQETGEYSTPVDLGSGFYQRNLAPEIIRPESKFVNPEDQLRTGVEGLIARERELSDKISEDEGSELQYERDLINSKLTEVLSQEKPVKLDLSGLERLLTAIEDVPVDREVQQEQLAIRKAKEQAEKDAQSVTQGTVPIDSLDSSSFEGDTPLETGGSSVQLSITASEGEGGVSKDLTGGTPRKFTPEGETYSVPDDGGSGYPTPSPTEFMGTTPETIGENNQAVMPFSFKTGVQGVNQEYSPPDSPIPTPEQTPESLSSEGFSASGGQEIPIPKRNPASNFNTPNPEDKLSKAIGKLWGIDRDEADLNGFSNFKGRAYQRVFNRGVKSDTFDGMARKLEDLGFQIGDRGGVDLVALLSQDLDENQENVYTPAGQDKVAGEMEDPREGDENSGYDPMNPLFSKAYPEGQVSGETTETISSSDSDDFLSSYTEKDIKDKDKRLDTLAKEKSEEDTKFDVDQELKDNNYEMELTPNLGEEQSTYKPAQTDLFVTTRGEAKKSAEVTPFRKDTGLTDIDDMFNKPHLKEYFRDEKHKEAYQIEVTPDAYLDALRSTDFDIDGSISQTRVDEYADRMLKGDKFPALLYDIHRGFISQEGRHRALAAKKIGVKSLPVSVVYETGKVDKVPSELSAVSKESTKPTESKTGNTAEALSQAIAKNFRGAGKMMESESLIVVQSTDELSAELKARADALHSALISGDISGTEGLYDPVTKKTYLVADMISDKNMKSVFLHEMLHKGYAENPKIRSAINSTKGGLRDVFNNAEKGKFVGDDANIYREAMKRVDFAGTTANDRFEEFVAYSVSMYNANPKSLSDKLHKLVKDLIAKVRQLGMAMGIELSNLTPADLNQMAISAINYDKAKAATSSIRSAVKSMPHDDGDKVVLSKTPRVQAPRDAMGMYSALEEAILNLPQEKGTWGQIRGMLKKDGVTDEELEWSTIKDKLRDPSDKVTKSGLLDDLLGVSEEDFDINSPEFIDQQRVMYAKFDEVVMDEGRDGDQYDSWTLPMGNTRAGRVKGLNYRMVAYKVPNPPWAFFGHQDFKDAGLEDTYINDIASIALFGKPAEEVLMGKVSDEALAEGESLSSSDVNPLTEISTKQTFDPQEEPPEGHFGSDTLMHYRATDRYTKDGKKILMVEELQSDWIQEGFKEGVGFMPSIPSIIANHREAGKDFIGSYGTDSEGNIKNWVYNPRGIKKKKGESAESLQKRKDAHLEEVKSIILKLREEYLPKKKAYDLKFAEADRNIQRYLTADFNIEGTYDAKNLEGLGVVSLDDLHRMRDDILEQNPRKLGRELRDIISYYRVGNRSGRPASVPDAPYKQKWTEFLMKRIMKKAHDEGYDGVGWTTGDQQNERYSISQFVSALAYEKIDVDTWRLTGVYSKKNSEDGTFTREVDDDDLDNTVGSELADRIRDGDSLDSIKVIYDGLKRKNIVVEPDPLPHDEPLEFYYDIRRLEDIFKNSHAPYHDKVYTFSLEMDAKHFGDTTKTPEQILEGLGLPDKSKGQTLFRELQTLLDIYGTARIENEDQSPLKSYQIQSSRGLLRDKYYSGGNITLGSIRKTAEFMQEVGVSVNREYPEKSSIPEVYRDRYDSNSAFQKEVKEVGKRIQGMLDDLDVMWKEAKFDLYEEYRGEAFHKVHPTNPVYDTMPSFERFPNLNTLMEIPALKGEDMEVDGEGKKNFYDRKLVNQVNAYSKKRKWGAKRETLTLTDSTEHIGRVIAKNTFQGYDVVRNPEFGDGGNYNIIVDPEGNRVGDVSFIYRSQAFEYIAEMLDLDIPNLMAIISEASSPDGTISNQTTEVHGLMFTDDAHRDLELRGVPKFSKAYPEGGGDQINTLNLGQDSNGEEVIVTTTNPMMTKDSKPSAFYKEWFTKEGGLGEQAFARNIEAMGMKNRDEVEIEFLHAALENAVKSEYKGKPEIRDLHPAVQTQFNNYINGDTVTPFPPIPDKVKEPLNMMRASLDRMSVKMQEIVGEELSLIVNKQNNEDRIASLDYVRAIVDGEISTPELEEGVPDSVIAKVALFTTIQGNLGKYINRSYRVFDDETWADKVRENKPVMDAARKAIAKRLEEESQDDVGIPDIQNVDKDRKISDANFNDRINAEIDNILDSDHNGFSGVLMSEVGRKNLSIWRKRKDIEPEILALMGEYEDVGVNYSRSVHKMSYLYANHHFLKSVREDGLKEGGFLSTKRTGRAYKLIAPVGSNEMTPLAGLYAPPEFVQALNEAVAPKVLNDMVAQLRKLNSMVKVGKTIYSPTTQARNLISAFGFTVLSGHFNYTHGIDAAKHTLADLSTHGAASQAYLEKLVSMGVLHDNPRASELKDALEEVGLGSGNVIVEGKTKTTRFAKTKHKQLVKLYRAGDDLWKIIGFENEKEAFINSGMSVEKAEKKAAERIRNGYPTYSMVPKFIKALRRNPFVGTFVSFPWEIGRTAYNNGKFMFEDAKEGRTLQASRRLVGMLLAGFLPHIVSEATKEAFGLDDKDEDAIRHLAPEWQRNATLAFTGYDEHGNIQYLDLSHLDPYTIIKKPFIALFNDNNEGAFERVGDALKELYSPFLGAEMGFKGLVDIAVNKKDSGAPVYGEHGASIASRTSDSAEHIFNTLAPSVTHNAEKLVKAGLFEPLTDWGVEKKSKSSKKLVLKDEIMALVGFRFSTLDAARSLTYQAFDYQRASSDASHGVYSVMGDPNIGQYENVESAVLYAQRQLDSQWKIMESHLRAAKITGLTRKEIIKSLRAGGMPKYKVADLLRGRTPVFRVNKSSLKSSLGRATRDTEGEEKKESRAEWFKRKKELLRATRELRAEKKLGKFPVKETVH